MKEITKKLTDEKNHTVLLLFFCVLTGTLIRLYYMPLQIPVALDALDYFVYAIAINKEGWLPDGYISANFGWSIFLSLIFSLFPNNELIDLMNIQRILSSIISASTVIPIYFTCRIFFKKNISLLSSILFVFSPHVIQNSVLGIIDPSYIFFLTLTILFMFVKKRKLFFMSFVFAGICTILRYEGMILIFPLLITFVIRKDFQINSILKLILGIIFFISIIFLMNTFAYQQLEIEKYAENKEIFSPILGGLGYVSDVVISENSDPNNPFFNTDSENQLEKFIYYSSLNYMKFLGYLLLPISLFFIIPGLVLIRKKLTKNKMVFLVFFIFISIVGIYAYGRGIQDIRYLIPLFPILILFSSKFFMNLEKRIDIKKIIVFTIFFVIVSSLVFLEYKKTDNKYEEEIYDATKYVVSYANGVNIYEGSKFVRTAILDNSWPEIPSKSERGRIASYVSKIPITNSSTLSEIIEEGKNNNLTHLVITEKEKNLNLKKLIYEAPPDYLEKIYDSKDFDAKNIIFIFKIKYEILN